MKNAVINARIESHLKTDVELILKDLGLTATQAINIFYQQIKLNYGLPFEVKIPNEETIKAVKEAKANKNMETVTINQLKKELTL